jgi:hypothetical protein
MRESSEDAGGAHRRKGAGMSKVAGVVVSWSVLHEMWKSGASSRRLGRVTWWT